MVHDVNISHLFISYTHPSTTDIYSYNAQLIYDNLQSKVGLTNTQGLHRYTFSVQHLLFYTHVTFLFLFVVQIKHKSCEQLQ